MKASWARDRSKVHRVGIRTFYRRFCDKYAYGAVCPCGWEGITYWKRKPAEADRDAHIAEIIAAGGQANDRRRRAA